MTENGQCEGGWTVTPEMGLEILEGAKKAVFDAFEGQGDSPASAVASAIVGYRNAVREIHELRNSSASPSATFDAWCYLKDDQDVTGKTTYTVLLAHMEHLVTVARTDERSDASSLQFVISHELERAYRMGMIAERQRAGGGSADGG